VSATPADYELQKSEGIIVEQLIRPTGLLDPLIEVRSSINQMDDLIEEIQKRIKLSERTLVTTLTKRMAEELQKYLDKVGVACRYIHSDIDTIERVEILRQLRLGVFDVLIGVNLLREGLDLPEVSLVAILDADKEGFLRDQRSLVQTVGRAARNVNGYVIMYADKITKSMEITIEETARRRTMQIAYNDQHGLVPTALNKSRESILESTTVATTDEKIHQEYLTEQHNQLMAAEPEFQYQTKAQLDEKIKQLKNKIKKAAKELDFIEAARYRDELQKIEQM
jgi:excinuclease ABC subunit B